MEHAETKDLPKVFVLIATHPSVPGDKLSVHATKDSVEKEASELASIIAETFLYEGEVNPNNWRQALSVCRQRCSDDAFFAVDIHELPLNGGIASQLLAHVGDKELINEISLRSHRMPASIWTHEDLIDMICEDERCAELDDEKLRAIAEAFYCEHGNDLEARLGEKGNEITELRWEQHKDEILEGMGIPSIKAASSPGSL